MLNIIIKNYKFKNFNLYIKLIYQLFDIIIKSKKDIH